MAELCQKAALHATSAEEDTHDSVETVLLVLLCLDDLLASMRPQRRRRARAKPRHGSLALGRGHVTLEQLPAALEDARALSVPRRGQGRQARAEQLHIRGLHQGEDAMQQEQLRQCCGAQLHQLRQGRQAEAAGGHRCSAVLVQRVTERERRVEELAQGVALRDESFQTILEDLEILAALPGALGPIRLEIETAQAIVYGRDPQYRMNEAVLERRLAEGRQRCRTLRLHEGRHRAARIPMCDEHAAESVHIFL
mmetsp:Transcript_85875/g.184053  ORF Transcript_85875/g.184053 Transcript_85875/m.184053 type:complete len:253 (-) Transcript_85875:197-955(-)